MSPALTAATFREALRSEQICLGRGPPQAAAVRNMLADDPGGQRAVP